jgi:hypothetical protein
MEYYGSSAIKWRKVPVATIRKGMEKADHSFDARRQTMNTLDVTVELTLENIEPVFYPRCVFKVADKPIFYTSSRRP